MPLMTMRALAEVEQLQCGSEGVCTVIRYYSRDRTHHLRRLSKEKAVALTEQGLRLGIVPEARRGGLATSFERTAGVADARCAREYDATLRQPEGSAILFAVDLDTSPDEVEDLDLPYFRGVNDAFSEMTLGPRYPVGVHGSGAVCTGLLDAPLVTKTCLAQARGWRGYEFLSRHRDAGTSIRTCQ